MELQEMLRRLYQDKAITKQQYRTYKGQVTSGNAVGCITGLKRKRLITDNEADALILSL
jgi:hypothetical protein